MVPMSGFASDEVSVTTTEPCIVVKKKKTATGNMQINGCFYIPTKLYETGCRLNLAHRLTPVLKKKDRILIYNDTKSLSYDSMSSDFKDVGRYKNAKDGS